jgi:hypothetical protein
LKLRTAVLVTIVAALCTVATWAQMPNVPSFAADMKMTPSKGETITGKMYFGSKHMRMEMNARGQNMIMINDYSDMNSVKVMMLMPAQHMYMEFDANAAAAMAGRQRTPQVHLYDPTNPCASEAGTTCKNMGTETVNGYACDKWQFTGKTTSTVWISQKLHFPIKVVNSDGTVMEFSNISEAAQDPSLFTVPSGYQKMDMGAMMGGRKQQ